MRVLVAGCGAMGLPMAEALLDAGVDVVGFDIKTTEAIEASAVPMISSVHHANADTLLLVVRSAKDIMDVCFEQQAIFSAANASQPTSVIVSSTVSSQDVLALRKRLDPAIELLEAPMSGAPIAAQERRLSFMLAGDNSVLDKHQFLFEAMGSTLFRVGNLGQGMLVKTLNNTLAACSVLVTRRVLADAEAEGVDTDLLLNVLNASSGATWFSQNFDKINWVNEGYSEQSTIGILEKDMRCALASLSRDADDFDSALIHALTQLKPRS